MKPLKPLIKSTIIDMILIPAIMYFLFHVKLPLVFGIIICYQIMSIIVINLLRAVVKEHESIRNILAKLLVVPVILIGAAIFFKLDTQAWEIYLIIIGYILLKVLLTVIMNRLWH